MEVLTKTQGPVWVGTLAQQLAQVPLAILEQAIANTCTLVTSPEGNQLELLEKGKLKRTKRLAEKGLALQVPTQLLLQYMELAELEDQEEQERKKQEEQARQEQEEQERKKQEQLRRAEAAREAARARLAAEAASQAEAPPVGEGNKLEL